MVYIAKALKIQYIRYSMLYKELHFLFSRQLGGKKPENLFYFFHNNIPSIDNNGRSTQVQFFRFTLILQKKTLSNVFYQKVKDKNGLLAEKFGFSCGTYKKLVYELRIS